MESPDIIKNKEFSVSLLSEEFSDQLRNEINSVQLLGPIHQINEILAKLKKISDQMRNTRIDTDVPEGGLAVPF